MKKNLFGNMKPYICGFALAALSLWVALKFNIVAKIKALFGKKAVSAETTETVENA